MGRQRSPRRKKLKALRKIATDRELGCCLQCLKLLWPTYEVADERVEDMKARHDTRKPYLLHAYRCPQGEGWRVGHNYKFGLPISLCIGEMR
jgi:hypothetical protein